MTLQTEVEQTDEGEEVADMEGSRRRVDAEINRRRLVYVSSCGAAASECQ